MIFSTSILQPQSKGDAVFGLHKILQTLGYAIHTSEKQKKNYGKSTTAAIRAFQLTVDLPANGYLDTITIEKLNTAAQQKEQGDGPGIYKVSGYLFSVLKQPLPNITLLGMNVNLGGAAIYDTAGTLTELNNNGGFDRLGEATTDTAGFYVIRFSSQQYRQTESGLAEVVVYAIQGDTIIGRSTLAGKDKYNSDKQIESQDITLTDPSIKGVSEYESLIKAITPLLESSQLTLSQVSGSTKQIQFLSTQAGENIQQITLLIQAGQIKKGYTDGDLNEELLYGVGRQLKNVLDLGSLALMPDVQIQQAVSDSITQNLIRVFSPDTITAFVSKLHTASVKYASSNTGAGGTSATSNPVGQFLQIALNDPTLQTNFLTAYKNFTGNSTDFWTTYLPAQTGFVNRPDLIQSLQLCNQLSILTGNNLALVAEFKAQNITNVTTLMSWTEAQWEDAITKSGGVAVSSAGIPADQQVAAYAKTMQTNLNAAYPTQRINALIGSQQIAFDDPAVGNMIGQFIQSTPAFDISSSRITDFGDAIKKSVSADYESKVTGQLQLLQRLYQVSPNPDALTALYKNGHTSAYQISAIPEKTFSNIYSASLGTDTAQAIHDRATYITRRSENIAMKVMSYTNGTAPAFVLPPGTQEDVDALMVSATNLPDYANLFGSTDMCECQDCLSVYSPAAYFVDLLRFLERSNLTPQASTSVYDFLLLRRPDLAFLKLTCENTYTVIPYIDIVNEIMEYYVANKTIDSNAAYDTGDSTQQELRAEPQNTLLSAYTILHTAIYPFSLPYHQPLDVIRTYLKNLQTSRAQIMQVFGLDGSPAAQTALVAEQLNLSQEQYEIITSVNFSGAAASPIPNIPVLNAWDYYGYTPGSAANLVTLTQVQDFLTRTGLLYTDLVGLLTTQFINPGQKTLNTLQTLFGKPTGIDPTTLYNELNSGTWDTDTNITNILKNAPIPISTAIFQAWISANFAGFQSVVTLYEGDSGCDLTVTYLKTIQDIYENTSNAPLATIFVRLQQFIRLWRITGYTMQELDVLITSLGGTDITPALLANLASVRQLNTTLALPVAQLACLWEDIDSFSINSTYVALFLNKTQTIDPAFMPDPLGNYFINPDPINQHIPAILSAYKLSGNDFAAIASDIETVNGINVATALLGMENLSHIYRYIVLSTALDCSVSDFITLKTLLTTAATDPFLDPSNTIQFTEQVAHFRKSGFQPAVLNYILTGNIGPSSTFGISTVAVMNTLYALVGAIAQVDQDHPDTDIINPTEAGLRKDLSLIFSQGVIEQFVAMLKDTVIYSVQLQAPFPAAVAIPPLASGSRDKLSYDPVKGLLVCIGVLQAEDQTAWVTAYANVPAMTNAVNSIYIQPQTFIGINFSAIFGANYPSAYQALLNFTTNDLPAQTKKYQFFYTGFLPFLKSQLKNNAITNSIAQLTALDGRTAGILTANSLPQLLSILSSSGLSVNYFNNATWTNPALFTSTDTQVHFDWTQAAPVLGGQAIIANPFSVSWQAWISPSVTDDYTFIADFLNCNVLTLSINDVELLQGPPGSPTQAVSAPIQLAQGTLYKIAIQGAFALDSAITLSWQTATIPKQIVPAGAFFPDVQTREFSSLATNFFRSALFINGFTLSPDEVAYFSLFSKDFSDINFNALTISHWLRMAAYTSLRGSLPLQINNLIQIFKSANLIYPASSPSPAPPATAALIQLIANATNWDQDQLTTLISAAQFNVSVADLKNEVVLIKLRKAFILANACGLNAGLFSSWAQPATDFNDLYQISLDIKNAVKSKYTDAVWPGVASQLSNTIREDQKEALISYLLVQSYPEWTGIIQDADSLFEYFLIDVQMDACMDTSRMVQAIAAVQLYVYRCLMGLESNVSNGSIDADQWAWMQNYSVWGAARKIFLYPENWLLEAYRDDKTPLFEDLESSLLQNDITSDSAEDAYRTYLDSLSEVSNLEICGLYQDASANMVHVFGRTHAAPYRYYYRYNDRNGYWQPWEKLALDIRSSDAANSNDSGVHLIPVVWKNRLFLFWPEFTLKQMPIVSPPKFSDLANQPATSPTTYPYYEIRLAWSESKNGSWSPKQLSKEFVTYNAEGQLSAIEENNRYYQFKPAINISTVETLEIDIVLMGVPSEDFPLTNSITKIGSFYSSDIQMPFQIYQEPNEFGTLTEDPFTAFFMASDRNDPLNLNGFNYFNNSIEYHLLSSSEDDMGSNFSLPFFFSDLKKTYYVTPERKVQLISNTNNPPVILANSIKIPYDPLGKMAPNAAATSQPPPSRKFYNSPPLGNGTTKQLAKTSSQGSISAANMINISFGGLPIKAPGSFEWYVQLSFSIFFHPEITEFLSNLNQGGLGALFSYASAQPESGDDGKQFKTDYNPVVAGNYTIQTPYPPVNIDFTETGSYSVYNWELFFHAPLLIATTLSSNGQYADAMAWFQYIFNPTTDAPIDPNNPLARYWNFVPFQTTGPSDITTFLESLQPDQTQTAIDPSIAAWRDSPFNPFVIARDRWMAFMKNVVMKYLDNLIAWGDSLYMQQTRESINQATQLYVMASHILGPQPQTVPARGVTATATYSSLRSVLDDFSNAVVQLENIFPYSGPTPSSGTPSTGNNILGIGKSLYFCIPDNDQLLQYWSTIAGRLYNIRHCKNIQGLDLTLALFEPILDPDLLVQAAAQGLSIGSILNDLDSPGPLYRFNYLVQKATEFCAEVKMLGNSLLSALEKRDNEELGRLRAAHETNLLNMITEVRNRQVVEAQAALDSLTQNRETAAYRLSHFNAELLNNADITLPDPPALPTEITTDTSLPADTQIQDIRCTVDISVSTDSGVMLIPKEKNELDNLDTSNSYLMHAYQSELLAGELHLLPELSVDIKPFGVGLGNVFGGEQLGGLADLNARSQHTNSSYYAYVANMSSKMASYIRREQEWVFQANLAIREIIQLDKQLVAANIRLQMAQKELASHLQQVADAQDTEAFLHGDILPGYNAKFSTTEMYLWMKNQLFSIYQQSYQMAYALAKKAEKAYRFELGIQDSNFVQYGYWNSTYQGLVSGEQLHFALKQMEQAYIENNMREFELTKHLSLALIAPDALLTLIQTGTCQISLPEELFDMDFPGHYFRRIRSVSISIPCVAGPYTTINATLRLLQNSIRINSSVPGNNAGNYIRTNVNGIPADDDRFVENVVPFTAIATSSAQADSGTFELNFRDERYLPFEGSGAISQWQLQLNGKYITSDNKFKDVSQFDYDTISDIILHIRYTSREDVGTFKDAVYNHLDAYIANGPFLRLFSMKTDFPEAFYQLFHSPGGVQNTAISLTNNNFPLLFQNREISITQIIAYLQPVNSSTVITPPAVVPGPTPGSSVSSLAIFGQNAMTPFANPFGTGMQAAAVPLSGPIPLTSVTSMTVQAQGLVQSQLDDILILIQYKGG